MDSLIRLEAFLAQAGAAIVPTLNPGIGSAQVTEALEELDLKPTPEIVAWYGWHDGTRAGGVPRELGEIVPGGEFYDLAHVCGHYRETRTIAQELAARPGWPFGDADNWWPSTWLPFLWLFGKGFLAADLAGGDKAVSPIHVVWFDNDPELRARVAWPSIAAFVETMVQRFESGEYWVDDAGIVRGDNVDFPSASR